LRWRFIYGRKRKEKNGHSCFQVAFQRLGLKTDPLKKKSKPTTEAPKMKNRKKEWNFGE
jgi:hypothetical protein